MPRPALALLLVGVIVKEAGRLLVLTHNDDDDDADEIAADELDDVMVV